MNTGYKKVTIMANSTQNIILKTFEDMLERMPFERITVTALIKECNIGRNTFYYHYEDIYALLDDMLIKTLGQYTVQNEDWKHVMKSLLYTCRDNKKKVDHVFHSMSRDRLEHYVFDRTDSAISVYVHEMAEARKVDSKRAEVVADIVKYSIYGFILRFFRNGMKADIEESVDELGIFFDELLDKMLY